MISLQKFSEIQPLPEGLARMLAETLPGLEDRSYDPPTPMLQLLLHCHQVLQRLNLAPDTSVVWLCGKLSQDQRIHAAINLAEQSALAVDQSQPASPNPGNVLTVINSSLVTWTGCHEAYRLRDCSARPMSEVNDRVTPIAIFTLLLENCYLEYRRLCLQS